MKMLFGSPRKYGAFLCASHAPHKESLSVVSLGNAVR